jgi:hypothetical protein
MKLFKLIASKAGRVVFDDRLEAASPREAREQMRALLGLQSLTGVVYAVTEIPVTLIESIVDARITHAMQRLHGGQPPESIDNLIRPTVGEEVRSQLANMREQIATGSRVAPAEVQEGPQRFDAFAAPSVADQVVPAEPTARHPRRTRPTVVVNGESVDWKAVKRLYMRTRSIKQTAAHFELSPNTVKARIRREGWGQ